MGEKRHGGKTNSSMWKHRCCSWEGSTSQTATVPAQFSEEHFCYYFFSFFLMTIIQIHTHSANPSGPLRLDMSSPLLSLARVQQRTGSIWRTTFGLEWPTCGIQKGLTQLLAAADIRSIVTRMLAKARLNRNQTS